MVKLANMLKANNIKFRWTIFTDLNLYNKRPIDLEEVVYMKPSYDFTDYIKEADYGVQLSDTEGYSYFINECLQQNTPVICTNFPSAYESVEDGVNGYILDMNLSNLNLDKIVNNIPNGFVYIEKCTEKDWIELLNKKVERKNNRMFEIKANQDYKDTRPEFIEEYKEKEIKYNLDGSAAIKQGDIYIINNKIRAEEIEQSGLAIVTEIKQEIEEANEQNEIEIQKEDKPEQKPEDPLPEEPDKEEKQEPDNLIKEIKEEKKKIRKKK